MKMLAINLRFSATISSVNYIRNNVKILLLRITLLISILDLNEVVLHKFKGDGSVMKKKFRNVALATVLGAGILGTTAFTSHASASSLETKVVDIAETNLVYEGSEAQPRNLVTAAQKAWVYGTVAVKYWGGKAVDMFFNNGGAAYVSKAEIIEVTEDTEIIFNK